MIDVDLLEWLEETYPRSSKSWIFNRMLKAFKNVQSLTPDDYTKIGARELKRLLERT